MRPFDDPGKQRGARSPGKARIFAKPVPKLAGKGGSRLRQAWSAGVALVGLSLALWCLAWPEQAALLWPLPLRPLHARCMGAVYLASAMCLLLCACEADDAAARISLNLVLSGALAMMLASASVRPWSAPFLLLHAAVAASAAGWAWRGRELLAPAEQPDAALLILASVLGGVGGALALAPQASAALWPWPMPPALAPFYAAWLVAWALACAQVAFERRRAARRIVLIGLALLGGLLLVVSTWHLALFGPAAGGLWFGALAAGTAVALQRLNARTRPALG